MSSPKGGPKKAKHPAETRLTPEVLQKVMGESCDLSALTEIEVLFNTVTSLAGGGLALCPNLRSLALIDTALTTVAPADLQPLSQTLTRLNLSQQGLTSMQSIQDLPVLRELYLQENALTRIEGLSGTPRLQRLWLYGNKVQRIDGLTGLGELRELWLQQNRISRIGGMEGLVHLENFGIAGNKVAEYKDLQRLSGLAGLRSVSFEDIHFGACPVTKLEGYRNFALCYLNQVTHLDGLEVSAGDRKRAEDAYVESVVRFNNKIEETTREGGREALAIESRRSRTKGHGETLREEMVRAFNMLEKLVGGGLESLRDEHVRQVRVRRDNRGALERSLRTITESYAKEVEAQLAKEKEKEKTEDRAFALLEARTIAERDQAIMISRVQYGPTNTACQYIGDHLPDFQHLLRGFEEAQEDGLGKDDKVTIMRCHRVYNQTVTHSWEACRGGDGEKVVTLYICCGIEAGMKMLEYGVDDDVVLFEDPGLAARIGSLAKENDDARGVKEFNCEYEGRSELDIDGGDPLDAADSVSKPLRNLLESEGENFESPSVADVGDVAFAAHYMIQVRLSVSLFSSVSLQAAPKRGDIAGLIGQTPRSAQAMKVTWEGGAGPCYVVRKEKAERILPEYHLLVVGGDLKKEVRQVEEVLEKMNDMKSFDGVIDGSGKDGVLKSLEARIEEECKRYKEAIWEEVDPATADKLRAADEEIQRRIVAVETTRDGIENERELQESILRAFRNDHRDARGGVNVQDQRNMWGR